MLIIRSAPEFIWKIFISTNNPDKKCKNPVLDWSWKWGLSSFRPSKVEWFGLQSGFLLNFRMHQLMPGGPFSLKQIVGAENKKASQSTNNSKIGKLLWGPNWILCVTGVLVCKDLVVVWEFFCPCICFGRSLCLWTVFLEVFYHHSW